MFQCTSIIVIFILLNINLNRVYILCAEPLVMEGKIVGGSRVEIDKFPHAVFLSMSCGAASVICGSSIINQLILVTAAHCLQCKQKFRIDAHAGEDNLNAVSVIREVIEFKTHQDYVDETLKNDISLLLLSRRLPLGHNIKRVIINTRYTKKDTAYVAGWGIINDVTRERSVYLKMVKVTLRAPRDCYVSGGIEPGMLCAGTTQSNKDRPSKGDSGSALITTDHQQIGIVSFRIVPYLAMVVYTNVSFYYSWIQKTAKELYCSKKNFHRLNNLVT